MRNSRSIDRYFKTFERNERKKKKKIYKGNKLIINSRRINLVDHHHRSSFLWETTIDVTIKHDLYQTFASLSQKQKRYIILRYEGITNCNFHYSIFIVTRIGQGKSNFDRMCFRLSMKRFYIYTYTLVTRTTIGHTVSLTCACAYIYLHELKKHVTSYFFSNISIIFRSIKKIP